MAKNPTSRAPDSFWGARREEDSLRAAPGVPDTGHTVSRWYAMSDLSAMRTMRLNSSRTAICVTRLAAMARLQPLGLAYSEIYTP